MALSPGHVNQFIFSRERRRFGRQCLFSDRNELLLSVNPSAKLRMKYVLASPVNQATQLSYQSAASTIETENVTFDQHGMNHFEGGWNIKEVNVNDEESTTRYRKKVEREDNWGVEVGHLLRDAISIAQQNNAIHIYQNYFEDLPEELGSGIKMKISGRAINMFRDLWRPQRHLAMCEWLPSNPTEFLTVYSNLKRLKKPYKRLINLMPDFGNDNSFYIWDIYDPIRPLAFFDNREVVSLAKLCIKDENAIIGGLYSGQVCLWSIADYGSPKRICPLEAAHREVTSALCWVHSKSNTEFYSGSLDGSVKYWDTRDLKMPTQELLLEPNTSDIQNRQNSHGVTVLEFEYTIPVRYILGSDMGYVFVGNRKGVIPSETILSQYQLFAGPIRSIVRNPFFVKNFLVIGDWRARIWSEECKNAPSTMYIKRQHQLTCGVWSTGRCSLFVTGDSVGNLEFWDLLMSHRTPILSKPFRQPITNIAFHPDGEYLTIGLVTGDVEVMRLEEGMITATVKEKALIAALFEREISRGKLLESREEEIKLKQRNTALQAEAAERIAEEEKHLETARALSLQIDPDNAEDFLRLIEIDTDFRKALGDFHEIVYDVSKKRSKRHFSNELTVFEAGYQSFTKLNTETKPEEQLTLQEPEIKPEPEIVPPPETDAVPMEAVDFVAPAADLSTLAEDPF
ncbi:dynein axonemal intermediate chain 2-like [Drosophila tropicalis]|uniref:dynein axonemal intermediate chain 2-like n=1 Tax=Drosophila tropicalis TaxID=46794 RepID=UPI0035ABAF4A